MCQHNLFQNRLCPDLWTEKGELRQDVKEKLLEIANSYYRYLKTEAPILDILFTGSLANMNWTEFSDIDLHLVLDFSATGIGTPELTRDFFLAKKNVWNDKRNIFVKKRPVELYTQHYQEYHASKGQYSLLQDKWLFFPEPITKSIDYAKVEDIVQLFEKAIDNVASITDIHLQFDEAVKLKNNIILLRRKSIELDSDLSIGNLVFKELRNNPNSLNRLFSIISSSLDKKLSLESRQSHHDNLINENFTLADERQIRIWVKQELQKLNQSEQKETDKHIKAIVRETMINYAKFIWDKKGIWGNYI